VVCMLPACLVEDPPAYEPPKQTAPRIDNIGTLPAFNQIIVRNTGEVINFTIPVTSEDAGEQLVGLLLIDEAGDNPYTQLLPPSTLDDPNQRAFKFRVNVRNLEPGCHRFTVRVTHVTNWVSETNQIIDQKDLDEGGWFANIDVKPENANLVIGCTLGASGGLSP
jgi:hypothetical protein